jgi:hypothetical protein
MGWAGDNHNLPLRIRDYELDAIRQAHGYIRSAAMDAATATLRVDQIMKRDEANVILRQ